MITFRFFFWELKKISAPPTPERWLPVSLVKRVPADPLHKETYSLAKLTGAAAAVPPDDTLWLSGKNLFFPCEVCDSAAVAAAELQRCAHLKDDPEIYSRAVSPR